jgi:hypothetical protein
MIVKRFFDAGNFPRAKREMKKASGWSVVGVSFFLKRKVAGIHF